jgi:hypothetical protein
VQLGEDEFVDIAVFSAFVQSKSARLVVLGICEGNGLADLLLDRGIETVIYWLNTVEDQHAIMFSRRFFAILSEGLSVLDAFNGGKLLLPVWVAEGSLRIAGYRNLKI